MKKINNARSGISATLATALALALSPWALAQQVTSPVAEAPVASTATVTATEKPADQLDELDEVVVTGGRLYDRIVKAEDKFFKLYNELNEDDDFDTNCANVPIDPDSRMEQRFCMPTFFADAKAEQARLSQYCLSMQQKDDDGNVTSTGPCYEPPSAEQLFFHRRIDYVNNVLTVINGSPALRKMYDEVESLHRERAQYENRYAQLKGEKLDDQADKNRNRPKVR